MHRSFNPVRVTLTMLSIGWATAVAPAFAQQPAEELVPLKVSLTAQNQSIPIPIDPGVIIQPSTLTGQSELLGAFTGAAVATERLGVDGKPLFVTILGEWKTGSGDTLSYQATNLFLPQPTPGDPLFEGVFVITNGKGRFLGARGSGFIKGVLQVDPVTRQGSVVVALEGLITRPR